MHTCWMSNRLCNIIYAGPRYIVFVHFTVLCIYYDYVLSLCYVVLNSYTLTYDLQIGGK